MTQTGDRISAALADRYRIERELGQGGMATVYLAQDLKHDRRVALKLLRPELGAIIGAERFLAEIKVTANLQHPNILPLFDSGAADGLLFYVMPYVEGESLRDRLTCERQLPVADAVRIAGEIAAALEHAHRRGVVHRDIKPENILLQDGRALVADFGIALAASKAGDRMTQTGLSLGTPSYMSPEQAMGDRDIGPRSDVYALGAMTYEMLTGEPPFSGGTVQSIVAKVMTEKPILPSRLRDTVPPAVEAAVLTALQKLPADRFASAREYGEALVSVGRSADVAATVAMPSARAAGTARVVVPVLAAIAAVSLVAAVWAVRRDGTPAQDGSVIRFALDLAPGTRIATPATDPLAISPDGSVIVFSGRAGSGPLQLFARRMDELSERPLPLTEGATQPFFSPDGKWVGFFVRHQLKKVALAGGPPTLIADVPGDMDGAAWTSDGRIVLSRGSRLAMVPDVGGTLAPLSPADTATGRLLIFPKVLSDGRTVIMTRWRGTSESAMLWRATIGEGVATDLGIAGTYILGEAAGHLVYRTSTGALLAVRFDASRGEAVGTPIPVYEGIAGSSLGVAQAALSANGTLVYQAGALLRQLVITDRKGVVVTRLREQHNYVNPRFSPDGNRIAVSMDANGTRDIWVYDLRSGTLGRATTQGRINDRPEWFPDGSRVIFRSDRSNEGGNMGFWSQAVDGSGTAAPLASEPDAQIWEAVLARDGQTVVYRTGTVGTANIYMRRLTGDTTRKALADTPFTEWGGRPSPDGRWLAYESDESGDYQVYVRPLAPGGTRQQVSIDGGVEPIWTADPTRLYYRSGDDVMMAQLITSPALAIGERTVLFRGDPPSTTGHANYDISSDGSRVLQLLPATDSMRTIVVHGWDAELRARLAGAAR
jgi:serine/threonine-protein kinase